VIDFAGLPLVPQTSGQSFDQPVAAVGSLQQDRAAIGTAICLIELQHNGLRKNLGEQQTLCCAIFEHAGSLSCCFKHCLDNMFVAQKAFRFSGLHEFSGLDEGISVFSFIYGIPSKQILDEFHRKEIVLIGTATTVDEAIALEQAGVDVIAASGFEAGGHRGSFLQPSEDSLIGTMALVPQVVDAVGLPVVAAGGFGDARGIVAAFALGADGVQMGTAFLACEESGANTLHRKALLSGQARQTALTRGFTGRLARGIKNRLLDELNQKAVEILPYPLQRALVRHLSFPAEKAGRMELLPLCAGQSANLSRWTDVHALLDTLVKETSRIGGAVQSWSAHCQLESLQE
jgi:nitronate monooxygenase